MLFWALGCIPKVPSESGGDSPGPPTGTPDSDTGTPDSDTAVTIEDPCIDMDPDDPCCRDVTATLWACTDLPWGVEAAGSFTTVELGDTSQLWVFQTADTSYDVELYGEDGGDALIPDLADLGEVTVRYTGGCATDGEGAEIGSFSVVRAGTLVFAVGTYEEELVSGLQVSVTEAEECPVRPFTGCFTAVRNHGLTFTFDGAEEVLYQGAEGAVGGLQATVFMSMFAESRSSCDDVGGHMENWVVTTPE